MKVEEFIRSRPCLEEIDGYLMGLHMQIDHPEILNGMEPTYAAITPEVLKPLNDYKKQLLAGKTTPAPSKLERQWRYRLKRKPVRIPQKGPR